jgi:alcohol dehydrogenase (cytochrome c)
MVVAASAQNAPRNPSIAQHAPWPKVDAATSTNWSDNNGDVANSRYSPLDQINTSNVGKLELKWTYEVAKGELIREQTPLVIDGVMYVNSGSKIHAIDAASGKPIWSFDLEPSIPPPFLGKRGPSYADGRIYAFGSTDIFAVDAKTGKLVESFGEGGVLHIIQKALQVKYPGKYPANVDVFQMGYNVGATPKYHNGMFYIGIGGSDSLVPGGFLIAADAKTGAIKWVFNTIPQSPSDDGWEFTKDTWPAGGRRVGGGVWHQPAIDPALGMIYFQATNPAPDYDGSARIGTNLFTNSLIALDLATGKLRWYFQTIHHDIWDKDFSAGPVLFDVTVNGRTVKGVGSTGKVCYAYLFNRETGEPINPIVETLVPTTTDVPGEQVWPTQPIPYTARYIPQDPFCAIYPHIDDPELANRARPLFHPYLANAFVITSPGQDGGSDYGGPAFSPRTNLFYVSGKNDAVSLKVKPAGDTVQPGPESAAPASFGTTAGRGKTGMKWSQAIAAYDPVTGRQVWYTEFPGWTNAALVVTGGDVVFHGAGGAGDFHAFDARTGEQVFRYPGHFGLPGSERSGIAATPMTYRVNGKQYVAVVAGTTVLAFALP